MSEFKTIDGRPLLASDATRERNLNREGPDDWDGSFRCSLCERPLVEGPRTVYVNRVDGGWSFAPVGAAVDHSDPGYVGLHPVGPTCARKIPAAYRHREENFSDHGVDSR